jgi:hypothetical protein
MEQEIKLPKIFIDHNVEAENLEAAGPLMNVVLDRTQCLSEMRQSVMIIIIIIAIIMFSLSKPSSGSSKRS